MYLLLITLRICSILFFNTFIRLAVIKCTSVLLMSRCMLITIARLQLYLWRDFSVSVPRRTAVPQPVTSTRNELLTSTVDAQAVALHSKTKLTWVRWCVLILAMISHCLVWLDTSSEKCWNSYDLQFCVFAILCVKWWLLCWCSCMYFYNTKL